MSAFKHFFPLTAALLLSTLTYAQLYKIELDEKVKNASLIVEGKVIDTKSFWNEAHSMIYTTNTIEVYKSFKGDIKEKQIEVETVGGTVDLFYVDVSDQLSLGKGQTGIFFCMEDAGNLTSPVTHKKMLSVYSSLQGFLKYDESNDVADAPFANYKGIEKNLYALLKQKTGRTTTIINNNYKVKTENTSNSESGTLAASITSFSPTTVIAGALNDPANNTLTINGSGFGAVPTGSCAVRFKDGNIENDIPTYAVPFYSSNIISWSDTKIVIKVPGSTSRADNSGGVAATGKIAVVTSNGTTSTSAAELNVFYSVLNAEFVYGGDTIPTEPRMMNANTAGGYTYRFSTSTLGGGKNFATAPEKATFQRALNTWKEQTGLNFIEGPTTTVQAASTDTVNIVMFDNFNTGRGRLPAGTLASTYSYFSACTKTTTTLYNSQKTGFDIIIRNNGVSFGNTQFAVGPCFPSSDLDLEMVILHELGHALNLGHVNDDQESSNGTNALYINPSKVMHYAISNYVNRRSLDAAAYQGGIYATKKQGNAYGFCGIPTTEMNLLSTTVIPNDNCPASFPVTATIPGTIVNFDLAHATSDKRTDPQFTAINCNVINGQFVTNNAFYALKTSSTSNGSLTVSISGYATTPADEASCIGQGVRLALYDVSSCPTGQNYPQPVACRTFTGNNALSPITGLQPNRNYLLYFDGLRNTKASFSATLNGTALPLTLSAFSGEYINNTNKLYIEVLEAINVKSITVEKSATNTGFVAIGNVGFSAADLIGKHTYIDALPFAGNNFYRLAITNNDGSIQYSNIISLKNEAKRLIHVYPNPVKDVLYVAITSPVTAKYNYSVYDVSGKLVLNKSFDADQGNQTVKLQMINVAAGSYLVRITDSDGNIILKQSILKQ